LKFGMEINNKYVHEFHIKYYLYVKNYKCGYGVKFLCDISKP